MSTVTYCSQLSIDETQHAALTKMKCDTSIVNHEEVCSASIVPSQRAIVVAYSFILALEVLLQATAD